MNPDRPGPPQGVPTLTEVLAMPETGRELASPRDRAAEPAQVEPAGDAAAAARVQHGAAGVAAPGTFEPPGALRPVQQATAESALSADALTERVLAAVEGQVEQVLEYRLREVLAPILTRASDALVRDARHELSRSLREIVSRSVAEELLRQRSRERLR